MYTPTVHLNGTGKQSLIDQQHEVMIAARKLLDAMAEAMPHGRDYYVQGGAYATAGLDARTEHLAAMKQIQDIYNATEQRAMAIMAQGKQT